MSPFIRYIEEVSGYDYSTFEYDRDYYGDRDRRLVSFGLMKSISKSKFSFDTSLGISMHRYRDSGVRLFLISGEERSLGIARENSSIGVLSDCSMFLNISHNIHFGIGGFINYTFNEAEDILGYSFKVKIAF